MHFLSFRILGHNLKLEEVSNTLELLPTGQHKKGEAIPNKIKNMYISNQQYKEDCWDYTIEITAGDMIENAITELVEKIEGHIDFINDLKSRYEVYFWLNIYPEDLQINLNLSDELLTIINKLGVGLNISIINLKDLY